MASYYHERPTFSTITSLKEKDDVFLLVPEIDQKLSSVSLRFYLTIDLAKINPETDLKEAAAFLQFKLAFVDTLVSKTTKFLGGRSLQLDSYLHASLLKRFPESSQPDALRLLIITFKIENVELPKRLGDGEIVLYMNKTLTQWVRVDRRVNLFNDPRIIQLSADTVQAQINQTHGLLRRHYKKNYSSGLVKYLMNKNNIEISSKEWDDEGDGHYKKIDQENASSSSSINDEKKIIAEASSS